MILETKDLGYVEIDEGDILTFCHAIYGFPDLSRYVILKDDTKKDNPFMWLQCVEKPEPCFIVLDPNIFVPDYAPAPEEEDLRILDAQSVEDLRFFVLATVPQDMRRTRINLKCPVAVNFKNRNAIQMIMENSDYPMRYYIFGGEGG